MELLVVIGIISILVGLLLPAVQSARQASRRTHCQNNLHQIGIAFHGFEAVKNTLPTGGVEWRPPGNTTNRQLAWSAFVLPYLDQQNLYDTLDLTTPFDSPENAWGAAAILPVYVCPSSRRGAQLVEGRGPCDYGGIFGERISSPNTPPKGTMIYDRAIYMAEIRDGASRTLVVSEDTEFADGQWINGRNLFDQAFAINSAPKFENDIRSEHPGGANTLLADSSVRFLSESISLEVLAAICTRSGGEVESGAPF